jgi:uncharacterized surface protein with fasciclin (FAS1) repeats
VFAPTNDAFAALGTETLNALLADPGGALTDILTYHVASGAVPASEVVKLSSVETLNGQDIWISVVDGKVILNPGTPSEAEVIITDVYASNGVIHVIDAVLLPLDIVDTAIAAGFDTLVAALAATEGQCAHHVDSQCPANLLTALRGEGPFTVFAPTDEAFAKLFDDLGITGDELLGDPDGVEILTYPEQSDLVEILTYHVLAGEYDAADVVGWAGGPSPATVQGQNLWVSVVDGRVFINAGTDSVAEVILTDILTTNGIIHVIDAVLLPLDIVDTAITAGFDVLVAALSATEGTSNLVTALRGDGPFTVFAPTDDAFGKLPAGTIDTLLADPGGQLTQILTYHVIAQDPALDAAAVIALDGKETPKTLEGSTISVDVVGGNVVLNQATNNATVIVPDIIATNGIIHAIDMVLTPPAMHAR